MRLENLFFAVFLLFLGSQSASAKKIISKPKITKSSVNDFDYHPEVHGVITYLSDKQAEIFDIKNARQLMVIKNESFSPMTATAWLRFKDDNERQMLAVGHKSGIVTVYAVDLEKGSYEPAQKFLFYAPVDALVARPVKAESKTSVWAVVTGKGSEDESAGINLLCGLDEEFRHSVNALSILSPSIYGSDTESVKSVVFNAVAEIYKGIFATTVLTLLNGEQMVTMNLGGKFAGAVHFPSDPNFVVMGDADVKENYAQVRFFDVKKQSQVFNFPIHSEGADVTALAFIPRELANKDESVLAVASGGGAIDFWHVDPTKKTYERIGFLEPQLSAVTKLYWLYNGGDDNCDYYWFMALTEDKGLSGWELEIYKSKELTVLDN